MKTQYLLVFLCSSISVSVSIEAAELWQAQPCPEITIIEGYLPYLDAPEDISITYLNPASIANPYCTRSTRIEERHFRFELKLSDITPIYFTIGSRVLSGGELFRATGDFIYAEPGDSLYVTIPSEHSRLSEDVAVTGRGMEKYQVLKAVNQSLNEFLKKELKGTGLDHYIHLKSILEKGLYENRDRISRNAYAHMKSKLVAIQHYSALILFEVRDITTPEFRKMYEDQFVPAFPLSDLIIRHDTYTETQKVLLERIVMDHEVGKGASYEPSVLTDPQRVRSILEETDLPQGVKNRLLAQAIIETGKRFGWNKSVARLTSELTAEGADSSTVEAAQFFSSLKKNSTQNFYTQHFMLADSAGRTVDIERFKGKTVLIDFFYNGCGNCIKMNEVLNTLENQFAEANVTLVSISIDPTPARFRAGIGRFCSTQSFPLYTGGRGSDHPIIKYFAIRGYPTLVLVDKNGDIRCRRCPDPRIPAKKQQLMEMVNEIR